MGDVYADIDFSFELNSTGDLKMVTNADAILQSIKMILFTRIGLRPGTDNENFGTNTQSFIFAPVTKNTASSLGENILLALRIYEPRINVVNIDISMVDDKEYDINIEYEILIPEEVGTKSFRLTIESL